MPILIVALVIGVVAGVATGSKPVGYLTVLLASVGMSAWVLMSGREGKKTIESARAELDLSSRSKEIDGMIDAHITTLGHRRDLLIREDRYGVSDRMDWNREIDHFIDKVLLPNVPENRRFIYMAADGRTVLRERIETRVTAHVIDREIGGDLPEGITPLEFEGACAAVLRKAGWAASTTAGSGDQGADVVGRHEERTVVLQCKLYEGVVGNKAVQEAISAREFYRADIAAVVSRGRYTRSAEQLAAASRVRLLAYSELKPWIASLG